jgi:hypothetical protein
MGLECRLGGSKGRGGGHSLQPESSGGDDKEEDEDEEEGDVTPPPHSLSAQPRLAPVSPDL